MARPSIEIDKEQFEKLCALHCVEEEIASFFDCSPDTIARWCEKTYEMGFADVYRRKSANGKISLRRKRWAVAMDGNIAMLIWLSKQHLGEKDISRIELSHIPDEAFVAEAERRLKLVPGSK